MTPLDQYRFMKQILQIAVNQSKDWTDIPKQNIYLNNTLDTIIKCELNPAVMREQISEPQATLFKGWLEAFVCKHHKS